MKRYKEMIISGIIIIVIAYLFLGIYLPNCTFTTDDVLKAEEEGVSGWVQDKTNIFKTKWCAGEGHGPIGFLDKTKFFITNSLGFEENFYDFLPSLFTGALAGLWIYLIFLLAGWSTRLNFLNPVLPKTKRTSVKDISTLRTSWLGLIGSSLWKIIPIAVGYAVLMQVPIINSFIQVITLQPLLAYKDFWGDVFLRSIIISFYIGFLPGAIEGYTRYRLRKKYYSEIMRAKYRSRGMDAVLSK